MVKLILWLVILLTLGYVVYFLYGYFTKTNVKQKDIGVSYSQSDASDAIERSNVEVRDLSALSLGSNFNTEGTVSISDDFSDAEISAIQNGANSANGPFRDVQIHFIGDGQVEGSGFISHPQVNAPVYARGSITNTGPKSFSVDLKGLEVGGTAIPSLLYGTIEDRFNEYVNDILSEIEGLNVKNVEIKDGSVFFEGDVPQKIY